MSGTITVVAEQAATGSQSATPSGGTPAVDSGGGAQANATPSVSGPDVSSHRGLALLVAGLVLAGGLAYLAGLVMVEEPRVRRVALGLLAASARAVRRPVVWTARLLHLVRPAPAPALRRRHAQ